MSHEFCGYTGIDFKSGQASGALKCQTAFRAGGDTFQFSTLTLDAAYLVSFKSEPTTCPNKPTSPEVSQMEMLAKLYGKSGMW
jgi:hypothetical protein